MTDLELLERYATGCESLITLIGRLNPEQTRVRPVDGTWSPLELVCHLADSEMLFAQRMKRVLAEEQPPLRYADPDRFQAALACQSRNLQEEVSLIQLVRKQMLHILESQPAEAWNRTGIHDHVGEQSLRQLVQKAIGHLEHHLVFLRAKIDAE